MKVFVYGTLMNGHGNWAWCLKGRSEFQKKAQVAGYKMLQAGFPVAKPSKDIEVINGEIFDIGDNKQVLADLDRLEGYREHDPDGSMYVRTEVTTECGETVSMYVGGSRWDERNMPLCNNVEAEDGTTQYWWK